MQPPPQRDVPDQSTQVTPVIFRYTCRGALFLDDDVPPDAAAGAVSGRLPAHFDGVPMSESLSVPRCLGIESRLRKVRAMPRSTRDVAVRDFVEETSSHLADLGADRDDPAAARSGGRNGGRVGVYNPSAGDRPRLGPAAALPVGPDAADFGPAEDDGEDSLTLRRRMSGGVKIQPPPSSVEDGETDADLDYWSTLACYGTTQVSVLLLRDEKKAEVAAVASENTLGLTVRDEGNSSGGQAITTVRIGPLEVNVGNHYEFDEEEEQKDRDQALDEREKPLWPPKFVGHKEPGKGRFGQNGIWPGRESDTKGEKSRPPLLLSSEEEEVFTDRFKKTLNQTADAMWNNAKMVKNEMSDDFPVRMTQSGERIIGQFGKTLERTKKLAVDVFRMWSDDDDGE